MPLFPSPALVSGLASSPRMHVEEANLIHLTGPSFDKVAEQYADAEFAGARVQFSPELFARTIGKIAYCAAVCAVGIEPLRHAPIRRALVGNDAHIGRWVGSWGGDRMNRDCGLHGIQVRSTDGSDVHVIVGLFAQFGAPEYHVALGPLAPGFVKPADWLWA
jgi:hypothetical protein